MRVLSGVACLSKDSFTFRGACLLIRADAFRIGCGVGLGCLGPKSRNWALIEQVKTVSKNAQTSIRTFARIN
jgi:hypothetical protein